MTDSLVVDDNGDKLVIEQSLEMRAAIAAAFPVKFAESIAQGQLGD